MGICILFFLKNYIFGIKEFHRTTNLKCIKLWILEQLNCTYHVYFLILKNLLPSRKLRCMGVFYGISHELITMWTTEKFPMWSSFCQFLHVQLSIIFIGFEHMSFLILFDDLISTLNCLNHTFTAPTELAISSKSSCCSIVAQDCRCLNDKWDCYKRWTHVITSSLL
jgi:hypothetical protein